MVYEKMRSQISAYIQGEEDLFETNKNATSNLYVSIILLMWHSCALLILHTTMRLLIDELIQRLIN